MPIMFMFPNKFRVKTNLRQIFFIEKKKKEIKKIICPRAVAIINLLL